MDQLFFTISFTYEVKPKTLAVDLCADIEMIDDKTFWFAIFAVSI